MNKLAFIISAVIVSALVGTFSWYEFNLQPVDASHTQTQTFTLHAGTSTEDLAADLGRESLIRSPKAFVVYVTLRGLRRDLQAGSYELSSSDSPPEIADILSHGKVSVNRVTLPEGITIAKMKPLLEQKGVKPADFDAALKEQYGNDFLQAKPTNVDLEGYLFPDSYEINKPVRPHAIVQAMLDNFARKVSSTDVVQAFASQGLTLHQGLTLASIVEREAGKPEDRPLIASVFYNRLRAGMALGSDVTVMYAAEQQGKAFDVNLDSAYNTYNHRGLPPGPICNPGLDTLKATAHPSQTDYLYFLADKQGNIHYAKTAAEHQANIVKYLK